MKLLAAVWRFSVNFVGSALRDILVGIIVAALFAMPGIGLGAVLVFLDIGDTRLVFLSGGICLLLLYAVVASAYLQDYRNKSMDESSKDPAGAMLMLVFGMAVAMIMILYGLSEWSTSLFLYNNSVEPTLLQIIVMVLDNVLRGLFLDIFEVFEINVSSVSHNPYNVVFGSILVLFRLVCSGLILAHIYLRVQEFRDPENWHKHFMKDKGNTNSETDKQTYIGVDKKTL